MTLIQSLTRRFHTGARPLINTVALARCLTSHGIGELFQQFVRHGRKPLKRLKVHRAPFHRAKATVLMRIHSVAQNCVHLSQAPDFASDDFSRLFLRVNGQWHSIKELDITDSFPIFYRPGFLESGRQNSWGGAFKEHNQKERADHPMMICTSKDGKRAIGS